LDFTTNGVCASDFESVCDRWVTKSSLMVQEYNESESEIVE